MQVLSPELSNLVQFVADSRSEIDREIHGGIRCVGKVRHLSSRAEGESWGPCYIEMRGTKKGRLDGEELLVLTTCAWLEAGSGANQLQGIRRRRRTPG